MSSQSLFSTIGIHPVGRTPLPSHAATYIIFHFIFAYAALATRPWKLYYGIDHNVSPREDLTKYGPKAVEKGKLTQKQLDQIIRVEGCHANSVENFPLFVGAVLWAHVVGLPHDIVNEMCLAYTVARVVYALSYILITNATPRLSMIRGVAWWTGNIICLRMFWIGGALINVTTAE